MRTFDSAEEIDLGVNIDLGFARTFLSVGWVLLTVFVYFQNLLTRLKSFMYL